MGRGDKKSRKGKIFKGSYGVSRPRKTVNDILTIKEKSATKKEEKKTIVKKKVKAKK